MKGYKCFAAIIALLGILCGTTACGAKDSSVNVNWKTIYAAHDGLAVATDGYKYGFVDKSGKTKLAPQWRNATHFSCGRAFVQEEEADPDGGYYWRVIDEEGRYVCPYNSLKYYGIIYPYIQDYAVVAIGERYDSTFIIDRDGLPIHKEPIKNVTLWPDGSLQKDGFFNVRGDGLMNLQGELVIPLGYDEYDLVVETRLPASGENGFPQGEMTILNAAGLIEVSWPRKRAGLYRKDGAMVVSFADFGDVSSMNDHYYYARGGTGSVGIYRMDGSVVIDPAEGVSECYFLDDGSFVARTDGNVGLFLNADGEKVGQVTDVKEIHTYKPEGQTVVWMLGGQENGWIVRGKDGKPVVQSYDSLLLDTYIFEGDSEYVFAIANGSLINVWGDTMIQNVDRDEDGNYICDLCGVAFFCTSGGRNWVGSLDWAVPIGQAMPIWSTLYGEIYEDDQDDYKIGYFSSTGVIQSEWDFLIPLRDYLLVANQEDSYFRLYNYTGDCLDEESLPFDYLMKTIYSEIKEGQEKCGHIIGMGNMVVIVDGGGNTIYRNLSGNDIDPTDAGNFEIDGLYDHIEDGLIIMQDDHIGVLSLDGSDIIIDPIYDYIGDLKDSRWMIVKDGKKGIIGAKGQIIIPPDYKDVYRIQELGIFAGECEIDGLTSRLDFYNEEGTLLAQADVFSDAVCYSEDGYASCEMGGLTYISSDAVQLAGKVIITSDLQIYSDTYSLIDGIRYGGPRIRTGEKLWSITVVDEEGQPLCGQIGTADERIYEE